MDPWLAKKVIVNIYVGCRRGGQLDYDADTRSHAVDNTQFLVPPSSMKD